MSVRRLDMSKYARKAHFDYFRTLSYPYVGTTVNVDVTGLLDYCHREKRSFYLAFMHAAALAADRVPELRQRILDDGIVEYEHCPTSHTELLDDSTYCYCTLHHDMPLEQYFEEAEKERIACHNNGIVEDDEHFSTYYMSSVPWLNYTALIQPVAAGDESNPRITWGKYEKNSEGKALMPVTILAHHALADGIHLARFYQYLDEEMESLNKQ